MEDRNDQFLRWRKRAFCKYPALESCLYSDAFSEVLIFFGSMIVFPLSAYVQGKARGYKFNGYYSLDYAALGISSSVLTLLTIPLMYVCVHCYAAIVADERKGWHSHRLSGHIVRTYMALCVKKLDIPLRDILTSFSHPMDPVACHRPHIRDV